MDAYCQSHQLQDAIYRFARSRNGDVPNGLAVFSISDQRTQSVMWYFTPEAQFLADSFGAQRCEPPEPGATFGLLVGNPLAWDKYFPNYQAGNDPVRA